MKVKEESEKVRLKLNIQKTKIMVSGPITSWEIDGKTVETVLDFIFGGSKIIADGDCSHEIKRHLLLGRKVMTNLDSILKTRDMKRLPETRLAACAGAAEGKGAPHLARGRQASGCLSRSQRREKEHRARGEAAQTSGCLSRSPEGKGAPHPGRGRQNFWLPGRNTASATHTQRDICLQRPALPAAGLN